MNTDMDTVHTEVLNGLTIKIHQDTDDRGGPTEYDDDGLFLVGYHRDFSVDGPLVYNKTPSGTRIGRMLVTKNDAIALVIGRAAAKERDLEWPVELDRQYHVFHLEAYIHSGVVLALADSLDAARFPDRQWDVSLLGAVFVSRKEWRMRKSAYKAASGLVSTWNDYLSGNVYGYEVEDASGAHLDSCWGFSGDYDAPGGALEEARRIVKERTNCGATDEHGQFLMDCVKEKGGEA